jgi:hypothetical protein
MISVDPDACFGSIWLERARKIYENEPIPIGAKRPWRDQSALSMAAAKLGIAVHALSADYDFRSWKESIET